MFESSVQICATLSVFAVVAGLALAYIAKPEIMTALYHIGDGVNVIQNAGHFANIFFLVVLGLNVAALIPVYFANPPCRRRFFGQEGEGACSCFKTCAQKVIGNVITAWMEILMFVSLLCCLGISCAFLFGVALITMLQNICQAGESAIGITVDIIKQIATQDGNVGQIATHLNMTSFCADSPNANEVVEWAGSWLVLGVIITVAAQVLVFQATAKAKETIQDEIQDRIERTMTEKAEPLNAETDV